MNSSTLAISELGRIVTGKTPSTKNPAFFDGEYLFITPSDLDWKTYYCNATERTVTEDAKKKHKNQFVPTDSVLVTCIGNTIGKSAISPSECLTNQQINAIVPADGISPKFVYYLLVHNTDKIRGVGLGGGSATPILNKTDFSSIRLTVPQKASWSAIAEILSTYDNLIENNRRRIQLLEQAARLLYKEWFVHLRFPGHEHVKIKNGVPEGWEKMSILDVWDISYGKNLPTKNICQTGKYPVHGADRIIGYHSQKNVDESLCLVTCRGAGSGNVRRTFGPTFVTNNCFVFRPKYLPDNIRFHFTMSEMERLNLQDLRTGAAQPQLTLAGINHLNTVIPALSVLDIYNSFADPLYEQADHLRRQIDLLAKARDLLLPKLMNGELTP